MALNQEEHRVALLRKAVADKVGSVAAAISALALPCISLLLMQRGATRCQQ
jgi:hypothetical protein